MQIFINDIPSECPENITITQLLAQQEIQPLNIAVAIDDAVVSKANWDTTVLQDGSRIIIIKAVQGG